MISLVINGLIKKIAEDYKSEGVAFETVYNSDLEMVSQYSKDFKYRAMFSQSDLELFRQEDLTKLHKDGYVLVLYNYSPFKRLHEGFNNTKHSLVFTDSPSKNPKFKSPKMVSNTQGRVVIESERDWETDSLKDGIVKDLVFGGFELSFKVLTSSTNIINTMQFIHVWKMQRHRSISMMFNFGADIGSHDFLYNTEYSDIVSVGHVDYNLYGNLQEMTFSVVLKGPFLSELSYKDPLLEKIVLTKDILHG